MKLIIRLMLVLFFMLNFNQVYSSDFGIYEKVVENATGTTEIIASLISEAIEVSEFDFLNRLKMNTPNLVRDDQSNHSQFDAYLILASSQTFNKQLVQFGNRYAANWILRIGVYQDEQGVHVQIANPETMTRIICNDLSDADYNKIIAETIQVKNRLRKVILDAVEGTSVAQQMPPVRSAEGIRKAKKDMVMMVGPMTFFKNKNQFPILLEVDSGENPSETFHTVLNQVKRNISNFSPSEKDAGYQWTKDLENDLKWKVTCQISYEGINAAVLGITRNRTEALSFHICGMKRENETNKVPGIDHVAAYPIEVVIYEENGKIKVGTPREMFRMDMFFWDAGKMAFMKYMNMPKMLDNSIKKAVTSF